MSKAKEFLDSLPDPRVKIVRALAHEMKEAGDSRLYDQLTKSQDLQEAGLLNLALMLHNAGDDRLWNELGVAGLIKEGSEVVEETNPEKKRLLDQRQKLMDDLEKLKGDKSQEGSEKRNDIRKKLAEITKKLSTQGGKDETKTPSRAASFLAGFPEPKTQNEAKSYWTGKGWGEKADATCYDSEADAKDSAGAKNGGKVAKDADGKWCVWKDVQG